MDRAFQRGGIAVLAGGGTVLIQNQLMLLAE